MCVPYVAKCLSPPRVLLADAIQQQSSSICKAEEKHSLSQSIGREHLLRHGWEDIDNEEERKQHRLAFIWPNKSGPQFALDDETAARVRPFPKDWTDAFDDKMLLSQAMKGSTFTTPCIEPPPKEEDINKRIVCISSNIDVGLKGRVYMFTTINKSY